MCERLAAISVRTGSRPPSKGRRSAGYRRSAVVTGVSSLSTADRGPDHGRLARIQSALNDLKTGEAADVTVSIEAADDAINGYRSDLEGV